MFGPPPVPHRLFEVSFIINRVRAEITKIPNHINTGMYVAGHLWICQKSIDLLGKISTCAAVTIQYRLEAAVG